MASSSNPPLSITVYRGSESPGTYVWSPFVTKLEARLRFAGLPYRTESGSAPKGPRGKIPYVAISRTAPGGQASPSPTVLGDSSLISEKLVEDNLVRDLNARLTPTEKTQDLALRALLEDRLYFYQVRPHNSNACHTTKANQRLVVDSFLYSGVRTMDAALLHYATLYSLGGTLPCPDSRWSTRLPDNEANPIWSRNYAFLR